MRIKTPRSPALLDGEVYDVLRSRGALRSDRFTVATTVEKQAVEYLTQFCGVDRFNRDAQVAFKKDISEWNFATAEVHHLMNLKPRNAVIIHLIIEGIEERFGEEGDTVVETLIQLVNKHFPEAK